MATLIAIEKDKVANEIDNDTFWKSRLTEEKKRLNQVRIEQDQELQNVCKQELIDEWTAKAKDLDPDLNTESEP